MKERPISPPDYKDYTAAELADIESACLLRAESEVERLLRDEANFHDAICEVLSADYGHVLDACWAIHSWQVESGLLDEMPHHEVMGKLMELINESREAMVERRFEKYKPEYFL